MCRRPPNSWSAGRLWAWPASARKPLFASSITRRNTTSGSLLYDPTHRPRRPDHHALSACAAAGSLTQPDLNGAQPAGEQRQVRSAVLRNRQLLRSGSSFGQSSSFGNNANPGGSSPPAQPPRTRRNSSDAIDIDHYLRGKQKRPHHEMRPFFLQGFCTKVCCDEKLPR